MTSIFQIRPATGNHGFEAFRPGTSRLPLVQRRFTDAIVEAMPRGRGGDLQIKILDFGRVGDGKLVKQKRKARISRNPKTGEKIKIASKTVVKFSVARAAKRMLTR